MKRIDRFFIVLFVCIMCLGIASIAEEITLTTYYPAPYGAYEELTVTGNVGIGTISPGTKLHVYSTGGAYATHTLRIQRDSGDVHAGTWDVKTAMGGIFQIQDVISNTLPLYIWKGAPSSSLMVGASGNVGIGTSDPTAKLHVYGNIKAVLTDIDGASPANMRYNTSTNEIGYDIAELFNTIEEVEPGDLLVIDETETLKLRKSSRPYEKGIIGVVSGSPAILFEGSRLEIAPQPGIFSKGTKPPISLAGRIKCKVSLENGPIEKGDLLTSSSMPGYAMKATDRDRSFGAIVGKALEKFNGGPDGEERGEIIVLIALQ